MFKSVLIANRGEIACRIMRTCRTMGIRSVAVYSDADRDALFVRRADEAVCIGPAEARLSYLNADAILAAAKDTGAEAVHPGYGFLSENAGFAQACQQAGLAFIGPSPDAIASMGSKVEAKAIAEQAGVPVVPGYYGNDQSGDNLRAEAARIGIPVLIKASAGGGGRGMRRVDNLVDFDAALAAARKEAKSAFGDDAVLLEKYITRPRHVEVQLLCDTHGTALHLYERDCSVQRNHQKVIEEAPAPNLPDATRTLLTDSALKLARAINYSSVGTVEYILDSDTGEVFFLEMNTRLQVEHPVTELITGIDLVEQMIFVTAGEKLDLAQDDITISGWAMEARVAAEDPGQGYLPQTGGIAICDEPEIPSVRIDSGITVGSTITPWYDSMIAKVIAHGDSRHDASNRLLQALDGWQLAGVGHNLAFLYDIVDHEDFRAARVDTTFLDRAFPDGWSEGSDDVSLRQQAANAWMQARQSTASPWQSLGPWRVTGVPGGTCLHVSRNGEEPAEVGVDGEADTSGASVAPTGQVRIACGRARNHHYAVLLPEQVLLNRKARLTDPDEPAVRAPMPGLISKICVAVGDNVQAGDTTLVLEAMKLMQNLVAPVSGTITAVHCQPGETIDGQALLIEIETEE